MCQDSSFPQATSVTGRRAVIHTIPLRIRLLERTSRNNANREVSNKWVYVFYDNGDSTCHLEAEIYARDNNYWRVHRNPNLSDNCLQRRNNRTNVITEGFIEVDFQYGLSPKGYFFLLSPVQLTSNAINYILTQDNSELVRHHIPENFDYSQLLMISEWDPFELAKFTHSMYIQKLDSWQEFVTEEERQNKLFLASTLKSWIGENDPAGIRNELQNGQPENFISEYKNIERRLRRAAEQNMRLLLEKIESLSHTVVEISCKESLDENIPEGIAHGILHWGNISDNILSVAPGRVFADKIFHENFHIPATHIFSSINNLPNDLIFGVFKNTWVASLDIFTNLIAAKIKKLKATAEVNTLNDFQVVQEYLKKLSVETELIGNYRFINERGRRPERMTQRQYRKLVRKADAAIPRYTEQANVLLASAGRYEIIQASTELPLKSITFSLIITNLSIACDDYRNATPATRQKQLVSVISASLDLSSFIIEATEAFINKASVSGVAIRSVGKACGFVSGVIDMLDHMEQGIEAAMQTHDYNRVVGHGIAFGGATLCAISGGMAIAEIISAGAVFGGPVGLIIGIIGAGLLVAGSLIIWWLTNNEYEVFASHCFFAKDQTIEVTYPPWSNHGGLSPRVNLGTQVKILFDLLSKFTASLVFTTRTTRALPRDIINGRGIKLEIKPGFFKEGIDHFSITLSLTNNDESIMSLRNLRIPDSTTQVVRENDRVVSLIKEWSREELRLIENFHNRSMRFNYTIRLIGVHGQEITQAGTIGGQTRNAWGQYEWNNVEF